MDKAYVLRYNIKYALADSNTSAGDKAILSQAQGESSFMSQMFWVYAGIDIFATSYWLNKYYASNTHLFKRMLQKNILFLTLRVAFLYEAIEYFAGVHLEKRVGPILNKQVSPLKT